MPGRVTGPAPWSHTFEAVLAELGTDPQQGLSTAMAHERLALGRNIIPEPPQPTVLQLVGRQLRETMIVILLLAGVLTAVTADVADTIIIGVVVLLNTTLGVVQERRAQRAISALRMLAAPAARIVRDGRSCLVPADEVVPGDLLVLEAGDLVPADARVIEAANVEADEAILTGESTATRKVVDACPAASGLDERRSILHAGTVVTRGRARAVVTATGATTEVGQIAGLLTTTHAPVTPLQRRLAQFARQVAVAVTALSLLVMIMGLLRGEPLERMVLIAISLLVAAVPESLPAVVVVSLALAAQRMAARSAVVRSLPAVEALGSVTVIATDKTGTLTEGLMTAELVWTTSGLVTTSGTGYDPAGVLHGNPEALTAVHDVLRAVVLCNDAQLLYEQEWQVAGDAMEGALLVLGARGGLATVPVQQAHPRLASFPFDHDRARMTTVHSTPQSGGVLVVCKGSPEAVLELVAEPAALLAEARHQVHTLTKDGLRVLAVAQACRGEVPGSADESEQGLRLLGLVGLRDRPRREAAEAVAGCRNAGVIPLMITGDHPATASAIALDVGLLGAQDRVVIGSEVSGLDEPNLMRTRVFARIAPKQKLDIVQALQRAGHVVAMTGDGVNDAPALRAADVGVAMGRSGTEIARQAADVVLTDDNFATVVAAVEEGRRVYDNIRRFLLYGLSGGLAEVLLMVAGPAVGLPLPLLPGQILWVNLLTHGLPGVALGAEQGEIDALQRPPRDPQEGVLARGVLRTVLFLGAVIAAASLAVGVWAHGAGRPWQTMVFVALTTQQLLLALSVRSNRRSIFDIGLAGNPLLLMALVLNAGLLWLAVAWSPLSELLHTERLGLAETAVCLLVGLTAPLVMEIAKFARRRSPTGL